MAEVCTPVTVITAERGGRPYGTTVSAFTRLSADPPMIAVALHQSSDLLGVISGTGAFGVNVLGAGQADLAVNFARKGGPGKFAGITWQADTGSPRLPGAAAFLACRVVQLISAGDHHVVLAGVVAADSTRCAPLTYHRRAFGTRADLGNEHVPPAA